MAIIPDPEELFICPYDPVHRVAAKKFPYHLNKCRKNFEKCGEYKSCPFNARHVIPAPEYQYHMETCESKAAIEMEIAFEQSRNDTTGVVKGCTDIPKTPEWNKPTETENWDDDDEEPPPIITKPQPLQIHPPDNLPRPLPSRPASRKSNDDSPNRWYQGDKRGGMNYSSPRASRGRPISTFNRGDEHLLASVKSNSPLSSEILDQNDFPPLTADVQPSPSNRKHAYRIDSPLKTERQHPPTSQPPPRQSHQSYAAHAQPRFHSQTQPNLTAHSQHNVSSHAEPSVFSQAEPNISSHAGANISPQVEPNVSSHTESNLPPHTQHTEQGRLPPQPQHTYNIPRAALEHPTSNSQVRLALQNPPILQSSFAPPTNPVSRPVPVPAPSYPQPDNSISPPIPAPQQAFTQPPVPVNPAQTYRYNQPQPTHTQHYAPLALQPAQALQQIPPQVPSNMPPQHYPYSQNQPPQYQTVPTTNQLHYSQPSYPPQPQYTSLPPNQYNAPQYAPQQQQYYQTVPQYNPVQGYQHHPGQLAPNSSYQPHFPPAPPALQSQYAPSLTGSQVSVQRPPGPGLIAEKNRSLHQLPPPVHSNDAYLSANSVPIKLASMYTPPMHQPQCDETSAVTLGSQSPSTGRGRGRGLSPSASPKRLDNPASQPPSMNCLASQMQQVHLSAAPTHTPQPPYTYQQTPVRLPSQPKGAQQPNTIRPSLSRVMWVKQCLANIELLQIKRDSQPLTAAEEELIKSKKDLLEELKNF